MSPMVEMFETLLKEEMQKKIDALTLAVKEAGKILRASQARELHWEEAAEEWLAKHGEKK